MDPSFLTNPAFWQDPAPFAQGFPGGPPDLEELRGQVLFQTSGSSGAPKWIALSKSALRVSATAVNRHLDVGPDSCWGLALPLHHVGGFGVAARAQAAGCRFAAFGQRWDAPAFGGWLVAHRVSHTSLVPTQVHDLVTSRCRAPEALRAIVVGGGRMEAATGRAARDLGWPVLASYGMTEAASQIATQGMASLHSIYQPAPIPLLPIWRAQVSPEGHLRIAGPALFSGSLVRDNGRWHFSPRVHEWHETRDRVELAADSLTPIGRADAVVKVLGELVDPEAIERELAERAGGSLAAGSFAVIAVPDARAGHLLVPVFDASVDAALVAATLAGYHDRAPGFRRLCPAVTLEEFPKSPLGKPRRAEIAAELRRRAG